MKQPLILFLLFQVTIAFSQQKVADSLLQKFNNCKVDSTKIDILLTNATFFRDTKPEEAIFMAKLH